MTLATMGAAALAVYLALLAAVAEVARRARHDETPADHFLAGRSLGPLVLLLTIYATAYSGNSLLGFPGEAYRRGFSWIMSTGFMSAVIVVLHVLVPPLRAASGTARLVSPGDWIRHRFAGEAAMPALRLGAGVLMAVASANFLCAQLIAMGHVAAQATDHLVPYWAGVVGLAAAILAYETLGGMRAVAWTDVAQGTLLLVALGLLASRIVREAGGLAGLTEAVAAVRPAAVAVPDRATCLDWASTVVLMGVGSTLYPQMIQRVFAGSSGRAVRRALAYMTVMPLVTTTVVAVVGLAAIPRYRHLAGLQPDGVMPRLLADWAGGSAGGAAVAVVVLVGALAAIMSTADSVLLSLGSVLAQDVLGGQRSDRETTRAGKRLAAAVMGLAVLVAIAPRFTLWQLIELKMELLLQCAPAFLLAARWPRLRAGAALAGLVLGAAGALGAWWLGIDRVGGVHAGVAAVALNAAVAVAGSLRARPARANPVDSLVARRL